MKVAGKWNFPKREVIDNLFEWTEPESLGLFKLENGLFRILDFCAVSGFDRGLQIVKKSRENRTSLNRSKREN